MYVTKNLLYLYLFLLFASVSANAILFYLRGKKVKVVVKPSNEPPPIKPHNEMGFKR